MTVAHSHNMPSPSKSINEMEEDDEDVDIIEQGRKSRFTLSLIDDLDWIGSQCSGQLPLCAELAPRTRSYLENVKYNPRLDPNAPMNRFKFWRVPTSTTKEPLELQLPLYSYDVDDGIAEIKSYPRRVDIVKDLPKNRKSEKLEGKIKIGPLPKYPGSNVLFNVEYPQEEEILTEENSSAFILYKPKKPESRKSKVVFTEKPKLEESDISLLSTINSEAPVIIKAKEISETEKETYSTKSSLSKKDTKRKKKVRRHLRKRESKQTIRRTSEEKARKNIQKKPRRIGKQSKRIARMKVKPVHVKKNPQLKRIMSSLYPPNELEPEEVLAHCPFKFNLVEVEEEDENEKLFVEQLKEFINLHLKPPEEIFKPQDASSSQIQVDVFADVKQQDLEFSDLNVVTPDIKTLLPINAQDIDEAAIVNGIEHAARDAANYLEKYLKVDLEKDEIGTVATTFANGDKWTGDRVADAIETYGGKTEFFICRGKPRQGMGDTFYIKHGYVLRPGFKSPCILDNSDGARYTRPIIIIINVAIANFNSLKPLIEDLKKTDRAMILIAKSISLNLLRAIHYQVLSVLPQCNQIIPVCFPKAFLENKMLVEDFGLLLGARVCDLNDLQPGTWNKTLHFGSAADVIATKEEICFLITKGRVKILKCIAQSYNDMLINVSTKDERSQIKERIRILLSKVCIFEPGQQWTNISDRISLIREAIRKSKLAIKYGIVPGGGNSLVKCTDFSRVQGIREKERLGYSLFQQQVMNHFAKYIGDAGKPSEIAEKVRNSAPREGFHIKHKKYCDLIENGLVEPLMCVKMELYQIYKRTAHIFSMKKEKV